MSLDDVDVDPLSEMDFYEKGLENFEESPGLSNIKWSSQSAAHVAYAVESTRISIICEFRSHALQHCTVLTLNIAAARKSWLMMTGQYPSY